VTQVLSINPATGDATPTGVEESSPADVAAVDRQLRDLQFNPDRHLTEPLSEDGRNWIRAKRGAIAGSVDTHRQRAVRCQFIRQCNQALQPFVEDERTGLTAVRSEIWERARSNQVARNREFAFVLHSAERLRRLFGETMTGRWGAADEGGGISASRQPQKTPA